MSTQQAPQFNLEKLNNPAEQIAIVQEYVQSTGSKLRQKRFAIKAEQKIAQVTPAATQAEKEKIETIFKGGAEFNKSINQALERDGTKVKTPDSKTVIKSGEVAPLSKNIKFKKGQNDVIFMVNPNLTKEQQAVESDNFAKKIISENQGNPHKLENKVIKGKNMYRILFTNPIK